MPIALVAKIALVIAGLSGAVFVVWDYINTKQENAVLEATLSSTTEAFGKYATNVEAEVAAWSQATEILSEKYQLARDERDDFTKRIVAADLTKMAQRHPDMLADRINRGTQRLFAELEATTRRARDPSAAENAETRADSVDASEMGGD